MQVFSKEEFGRRLGYPIDQFTEHLKRTLPAQGSCSIPADSGRKTALAKLLANLLLKYPDVVVCITGWNVWQSAEHLDLFYGYRKSHGEDRTLMDARVHLFADEKEKAAFISIVSLLLYFVWDAYIFNRNGSFLLSISNDEFIDLYGEEKWGADLKAAFAYFKLEPVQKTS